MYLFLNLNPQSLGLYPLLALVCSSEQCFEIIKIEKMVYHIQSHPSGLSKADSMGQVAPDTLSVIVRGLHPQFSLRILTLTAGNPGLLALLT